MLKGLKSLFFVEDEESNDEKKSSGGSDKKGTASKKNSTELSNSAFLKPSGNGKGQVSKKFSEILLKAMENSNLPGFDYMEFKESLQSLGKMQMDEATRYKSAAAMAKTMGVGSQKILESADHYLAILHKEDEKFRQALISQKQKQIGSKEAKIKELEQSTKAMAQQIKDLEAKMAAAQKEATQLRQQIDGASVKVQQTRDDFVASLNSIRTQILKDIENIKKYIN